MWRPLLLLVAFAACSNLLDLHDVTNGAVPPPHEVEQFSVTPTRDLDLLFLIDDSPAMADKQANLASSFPRFIATLESSPGGLPNVHIGVATSDMGTQGALDTNPSFGPPVGVAGAGGCTGTGKDGQLQTFGAPVSKPFIIDIADPVTGVRTQNYTGNLADVFAQIAGGAGANGCGFEQHLAAVKRALTNPANNGFLRPDAYLGVVIIAGADDCSLAHYSLLATDATSSARLGNLASFRCTRFGVLCDEDGQTSDGMNKAGPKGLCHPADGSPYLMATGQYASFLQGLKAFPTKVFVATVAGPVNPFVVELRAPPAGGTSIPTLAHSCSYLDGAGKSEVADPAVRIQSFLDQFFGHSASAPICDQELSGALQQIGDLVKTVMGPPCFVGRLLDADPGTAGPQYDCTVSVVDRQDPAPGRGLPRCDRDDASATHQPCWHIAADAAGCPKGDHLTPVIEGRDTLAPDGYVTASCALAPRG